MTRKQRRRTKNAALLAAFSYLCILFLGLGMLKAAQRTRQILYGGQPVMAQLTPAADASSKTMELGGGEWEIPLPAVSGVQTAAEQFAAKLPPCTLKYFFRLGILADRAADYTARLIISGE